MHRQKLQFECQIFILFESFIWHLHQRNVEYLIKPKEAALINDINLATATKKYWTIDQGNDTKSMLLITPSLITNIKFHSLFARALLHYHCHWGKLQPHIVSALNVR